MISLAIVHIQRMKKGEAGKNLLRNIFTYSRNHKIKAISLILFGILLSVTFLYQVTSTPEQTFTECYILNSNGEATNYSTNITIGENISLIFGLINHEQRTINYTVQYYLTNLVLNSNDSYNATPVYFLGQFSVTLDPRANDRFGDWSKQYEKELNITVNRTGSYKIWFLVFKDGVPGVLTDLNLDRNYFGTIVETFIVESVQNPEKNSVNLNIIVSGRG
jgi:uncharacterized membrane protein